MTPHGPDLGCFESASKEKDEPMKIATGTQAFMFESHYSLALTDFAVNNKNVDNDYLNCWQGFPYLFNKSKK